MTVPADGKLGLFGMSAVRDLTPMAPSGPLPRPRPMGAERAIFQGRLEPIEKAFLDQRVVRRRSRDGRDPGGGRYWVDEFETAKELSREWGGLLKWMPISAIIAWSKVAQPWPGLTTTQVLAMYEAGVTPQEIEFPYNDGGRGTLADRYASGEYSTNQVVTTVEWFRGHPESA